MKRFAVILAVVAVVTVCVGAPTTPRQAVAESPIQNHDGLTGKYAYVNTREYAKFMQNVVVRRVGSREFLAGQYVLRQSDGKEWQAMEYMLIPVDQIDSILVYESREKALILRDSVDKKRQDADHIPPQSIPATGIPSQVVRPVPDRTK